MKKPTFIKGSSTGILQGNTEVTTFEFEKTGLGYYINPKPQQESNSGIIHSSDTCDWYVPIHLPSRRSLGITLFKEKHVRQFVIQLAPHLDWSVNEDALVGQENWHTVGTVMWQIADAVYFQNKHLYPGWRDSYE